MSIFNHDKEDSITPTKKPSGWKIIITTAGALFAISHLGLLGYLIDRKAEFHRQSLLLIFLVVLTHRIESKQVKTVMRLNTVPMTPRY